MDEDLITHLQHQISGLESQLRKYRESHALRHGTLEAGFQTGPAPQDGLEGVGNNQYIPPYEGVEVGHSQDPLSAHPPNDHSTDARSHEAMEELASLMLTMDLEGQGEPSFTLPPGNSQVALKRELPSNLEPSKQVQGVHEAFTLTLETRRHLVGCFMQKFNIFHEFLDERDAKFIIQQQLSDDQLDSQFRNYALFAVGAHLSDDPDIFPLSSEFAGSAERMVLESIRQHSSDLIAQGLVLLAWRELVLGNNSMAYNYIGELPLTDDSCGYEQLLTDVRLSMKQWLQVLFSTLDSMSALSASWPRMTRSKTCSSDECGRFGPIFQWIGKSDHESAGQTEQTASETRYLKYI